MAKKHPITILYEDNHIIAVNKKSGDIVQGDKTGDKPLSEFVKDYLKVQYNKPGEAYCGTIHRIDRPVSGVVVFAKTSKALSRLNKMFQEKEVQKTYWAVVKNKPKVKSAEITHFLLKNQVKNKSTAYAHQYKNAKEATLKYTLIHSFKNFHLIEILPYTGRHHQIRVQLSTIGCPIKGDLKYGFNRSNIDASIHLHARKIEFIHPVSKKEICIVAKPNTNDPLWKEAQAKFQH